MNAGFCRSLIAVLIASAYSLRFTVDDAYCLRRVTG